MTEPPPIRIGTRGSQLALWQARHIASRLRVPSEITIIKTSGDRFLDQPIQGQLEKGLFTKEIEGELLAGRVDLAVHSLKDLPTEMPRGLQLAACTERADPADLLLVHPDFRDDRHPFPVAEDASIGATSLRRQSLLKRHAPHVRATLLRGNVPTRIERLRRRDFGAIILAAAGVIRLNLDLSGLSVFRLDPHVWIPAPGQAVLGLQIREGDSRLLDATAHLDHPESRKAVELERALLACFEGGCHAPFGAWAFRDAEGLQVRMGHDDARAMWKAARVTFPSYESALEPARREMTRVLATGDEPAETERTLCRPL